MTFDVHTLDQALLAGSVVLLLAILAVRLSVMVGFPSLLVYLLIGVGLGESGLGVHFDSPDAAHALGFAALVLILAEGGLTTPWHEVRPVIRLGLGLATLGVVVSVAVVAVLAHVALGLSWQIAVLLGAVTSPTDAAAVFSMLRRIPLPRRITATLEAESGFNDAPTVVIVTLVSAGDLHHPWRMLGTACFELVAGVVIGLAVGFVAAWLLRRVALPSSGLYPLAILAVAVLAYAGTAAVQGSGFAAVYAAALVLGNTELPHRVATRSFAEGIAWLAQIGLFIMLGLLASPDRISGTTLWQAVVAGAILSLVARPASVLISTLIQRIPWRDGVFVSWAGLRGAVPIVLATVPLAAHAPGARRLFEIVFVMVVVFTLVSASTVPFVARVLRIARRSEPRDLDVEIAPLERIAADLLQVRIAPTSRMHGVEISELRLPRGASVALIVREGEALVPEGRSVLRHGDEILVVTPRRQRDATEARLRAVSRSGRLAQWVGGR